MSHSPFYFPAFIGIRLKIPVFVHISDWLGLKLRLTLVIGNHNLALFI